MDAYDYGLPDEAIAQEPVEPRSNARLLVSAGVVGGSTVLDATVGDLPRFCSEGDVLVVNETRVMAARLVLAKATGGAAEVLLLEPGRTAGAAEPGGEEPGAVEPGGEEPGAVEPGGGAPGAAVPDGVPRVWEALVRPGRRLPPGTCLGLPEDPGRPVVEVGAPVGGHHDGRRWVRLVDPGVVERAGSVPLPPYIHRALADGERYQTVYAADTPLDRSSVAAPTAGLHLTTAVLEACRQRGVSVATVDLSIGIGTFRPVTAARPEDHVMHEERYRVPAETMEACAAAGRVVAVGTTVVRALESAAATGALSGRTDLFIHGDYPFRVVDVLLTNFHLPRSSLLLLVEAFYGPGWRDLYRHALASGYRFLSFGDAMLLERRAPGRGRR